MTGRLRVRVGLAAVAVGIVAIAAQPASASTGIATIAGTGHFAAGLGLNPVAQGFNFNGEGVIATDSAAGTLACAIVGEDFIGTVAQGVGPFNGNCAVGSGASVVAGNFTREGTFLTVTGVANGAVTGGFTGTCVFSPLATVTTTPLAAIVDQFAVSCQFVIT